MSLFSYFDLFYSILICFFFLQKGKSKSSLSPYGHYFNKGLIAKFIGVYLFCSIYLFYYQGGDTLNYFSGIKAFVDIFWQSPAKYFSLLIENEDYVYFADFWYYQVDLPPKYMIKDPRTLLVIKLTSLISIIGLGGFYSTSIFLAILSYRWIWKGFSFVIERYPALGKELSICFLYLPSAVFWGSGIMKDTFTFAATAYTLYAVNQIFLVKGRSFSDLLGLSFAFYIILSIKAYIIFALLPGIMIFLNFERISKIKSPIAKFVLLPSLTGMMFLGGQSIFMNFGDEFGKYSADRILEEAAIQQQDLSREEAYGGNFFDIGAYDPTLGGALSKAHIAVSAALFRPFLWEVGSPTMLFSALENTIVLVACIYFFLTIGPFRFFRIIFSDAFLIFSLSFTIILAFGIGLSAANFGALVRYKIPFLPFFSSIFFIVRAYSTKVISR